MMLNPGVYYIKYVKDFNFYQLIFDRPKFQEPEKIYGDMLQRCIRVWNHYAISRESTGCMFTGAPGSGKTKASEMLCNIAIDMGLPVILCVNIEVKTELIQFLANMKDCVLFFDEFKKNVNYQHEQKMLNMLADVEARRLFIITENDSNSVSEFIRNRPGRIRYHFRYDKISKAVFEDFCKDYKIKKEFLEELGDKYKNSNIFTFDQLQAIVMEHIHYPDETLTSLLETLNLHDLLKPRKFIPVKFYRSSDKRIEKFSHSSFKNEEDVFKRGYAECNIQLLTDNNGRLDCLKNYYIRYGDLVRVEDTNVYNATVSYEDEEYIIEFVLE